MKWEVVDGEAYFFQTDEQYERWKREREKMAPEGQATKGVLPQVGVESKQAVQTHSDAFQREVRDMNMNKELVPIGQEQAGLVKPVMSVEQAVEIWEQYQSLKERLLTDDDYIYYVHYMAKVQGRLKERSTGFKRKELAEAFAQKVNGYIEKRIKKSGARKLARFFGLTLGRVDEKIERLSDQLYVVSFTIEIFHPHGTRMVGVGSCSSDEYDSYHDVRATAFTRALNRAILDLVGFGEVSAEEVEKGGEFSTVDEEPSSPPSPPPSKRYSAFWAKARELGADQEKVHALIRERLSKVSVKELTDAEMQLVLEWLRGETENVQS